MQYVSNKTRARVDSYARKGKRRGEEDRKEKREGGGSADK